MTLNAIADAESWVLAGIVAAVWMLRTVIPMLMPDKAKQAARGARQLETAAEASGSWSPPATRAELDQERELRRAAHAEHERRIGALEDLSREINDKLGGIATNVAVLSAAEKRRSGRPHVQG